MKRLAFFCLALAALFAARSANAQLRSAGYIDTAFGAPCLSNNAVNFTTRALAVQMNGNILVGGNFSSAQSCVNAIGRLRTNGARDTAFTSPFLAGDVVTSLAVLPGGKILAGGNMRDGNSAFAVARLNASGSLDNSFQRIVPGASVVINALAVQSDNRVVAAGYDFSNIGFFLGRVMRLNTNGGVDATFASGMTSLSANNQFSAVAFQSGKILLGGTFTNYSAGTTSVKRDGIVRLLANGSIDGSFFPLITNSQIFALLVQPDDKILVAGQFDVDGGTRILTRLNSDGSRDAGFTSVDYFGGAVGLSLALQADGKILLGETFGVARLLTNGLIDTTFGPRNDAIALGTAAENATALAFTPDGQILVGATSVTVNNTSRRSVARLFNDVPPPPFIVTQPATQTVEAGTNVTLSIIATGAPPILFQWRKNGTKLKGETNDTLSLVNVHSTDTASYTVVVSNPGGDVTSEVARLTVNFHTSPIEIVVNGAGKVTPNLDGHELEIGRTFTLTAKPATGNLFSNWSGFETTNSPVLTFVMQSNEVLQANFVPSPFIPVVGVYNGLFFETNAPAYENAGGFTLKLDARGGFKGSVRNGAKARKFSGGFSLENVAEVFIPAGAAGSALSLSLHIDTTNGIVTGTVSNNAAMSALVANRNPFSSAAPSPFTGSYNIVFPGGDEPAGDSIAMLKVSSNGKVSGRGTLADKTTLKVLSATAADGRVPIYLSLYRGSGSLFGWLALSNADDVTGTVWWTKPGTFGGTFSPGGFTNRTDVLGERYNPLPTGTPILTLSNGVVIVTGGNVAEAFTNSIALGGDNKIVGDNQLNLTIAPAKGTMSGSLVDPSSGKKRSIKGVALPNRNEARGLFFGSDESGRVFIGEAP